jgi:hypothetical protein
LAVIPAETHFMFQNGCSLRGTDAFKTKSGTDKATGHVRSITSKQFRPDLVRSLHYCSTEKRFFIDVDSSHINEAKHFNQSWSFPSHPASLKVQILNGITVCVKQRS